MGVAFRNKHETTDRREIIVLITPHIVYEPEACRKARSGLRVPPPPGRLRREDEPAAANGRVGRRYFRMAQKAWAAGDRTAAMRFAEMAVQFDPANRAAIDLRSDIWLGPAPGRTHAGRRPPSCLPAAPPAPAEGR